MTPEQRANETTEFLKAFRKSGLLVGAVIGEWQGYCGKRCVLSERTTLPTCDTKGGWQMTAHWRHNFRVYFAQEYDDHTTACLILRSIQRELDEEWIGMRRIGDLWYIQDWETYSCWHDGAWHDWEDIENVGGFTSRPLAMLAAFKALKENTDV